MLLLFLYKIEPQIVLPKSNITFFISILFSYNLIEIFVSFSIILVESQKVKQQLRHLEKKINDLKVIFMISKIYNFFFNT